MLSSRPARLILLAVVAFLFAPSSVSSTGIYEDLGRLSSFVRATREATLESQGIRTGAPTHDASIYTLSVRLPLKSRVLIDAELAYVSLFTPGDIENGFGDARVRMRTLLAAGNQRALSMVGAFRAGSGSASLFPYSTASVDVEGGLAVVDTLSSTASVWAYATGTHPTRVRDNLKQAGLLPNFLTFAAGLVWSVADRLDLQGGALAYVFRGDKPREFYFVDLDIRYSETTVFYTSLQAEGGREGDRVIDFAAAVGIRVSYR